MKKKILIGVMIIAILSIFVFATQISNFVDKTNPYNITFDSSNSINTSSQNSYCDPDFTDCYKAFDGNWSSYSLPSFGSSSTIYLTFRIPYNSVNATFKYKVEPVVGIFGYSFEYWNYNTSTWVTESVTGSGAINRTFVIPEVARVGDFMVKMPNPNSFSTVQRVYEAVLIIDSNLIEGQYLERDYIDIPKYAYVDNITIEVTGFQI